VRLQAQPEIGPGKVADRVIDAFRLADRKGAPAELHRDLLPESMVKMLRAAQKVARLWSADRVDTPHLMAALLEEMPPRLASVLESNPLNLNLATMREQLEEHLANTQGEERRETAFRLPPGILRSEDLTQKAKTESSDQLYRRDEEKGYRRLLDTITRAMYRRGNNHVLVTGQRGVGKTTLIFDLARRAAEGEIPFLRRKRFLWVDCHNAPPAESREKLEAIIAHVTGRTDIILCLDGLGALLRSEQGGNNKLLLRAALTESTVQVIGILSKWDFDDLLAADAEIMELFTRVEVEEPKEEPAQAILQNVSRRFVEDFGVTIEERAIQRAVVLSVSYVMNERLPTKAIKILRRVCEDAEYERTQQGRQRPTITPDDVVRVVSEISGVPEKTLAGRSEQTDYYHDLGQFVVGQDDAVKAVADELDLIKAGLTDPNKPASVMFFAGLTGTGKTELAKALAKMYSASKRLQVYTMGNFTESHSVSNIIGVPPGYVGHEQGGRLINDLNADPYCVFLLDEAEKAHPDIWKTFLNLFDEGWAVDQRGVKAFGDKAIFILTSNAGHEIVSELSQKGERMDKIIEEVRKVLPTIRHPNSGQTVFSPEFFARVKRIIIFKPLTQAAMEGICRKMVGGLERTWLEKREKTVVIPDALIKEIGRQSHELNEKSGGKEGARVVRKLIAELIESRIQKVGKENSQDYERYNRIELRFFPPGPEEQRHPEEKLKVDVLLSVHPTPAPAQCITKAAEMLRQDLHSLREPAGWVCDAARQRLAQLESAIKQSRSERISTSDDGASERALECFRATCDRLADEATRAEKGVQDAIEELIETLMSTSKKMSDEPSDQNDS